MFVPAGFHGDARPHRMGGDSRRSEEPPMRRVKDTAQPSDHLILVGVDEVRQAAGQRHSDHLRRKSFIRTTASPTDLPQPL